MNKSFGVSHSLKRRRKPHIYQQYLYTYSDFQPLSPCQCCSFHLRSLLPISACSNCLSFKIDLIAITSRRLSLIPKADIISPSSKIPLLLGESLALSQTYWIRICILTRPPRVIPGVRFRKSCSEPPPVLKLCCILVSSGSFKRPWLPRLHLRPVESESLKVGSRH